MSHPEETELEPGAATPAPGSTPSPAGPGPAEPTPTDLSPADPTPTDLSPAGPSVAGADNDLGKTVAALTADDLEPASRRELLGRLVGDIRHRGLGQLFRPKAALRWMADVVTDIAPHVPVRDRAMLHRHFPGLNEDELAERLIRNAARSTAGLGAVGGGVVAIEWVATPTLLSAPVLLAAETVAVVAIELKLLGELHEVYGRPVPGGTGQRALHLLQSWSQQRGINPLLPGVGVATVLGAAARRDLQRNLLRRFGRSLGTMGPLLTGAAVAGYLNRRATRALGDQVQKDLKRTAPRVIESA
ncbi:hypothetical protein ODJ79_19040 [Actinoplanes sp. KI2]|uniref:hypothetical protein n=1 Tax=Actinoplanes sp. KI2 TaxID=2983315 RepID=UPI0021D588B7|nr:hypothetical protein [Actinoplanes sp. KI2]MCU7725830.1 hypothetical protein [Actinoplanes sp. KI2]